MKSRLSVIGGLVLVLIGAVWALQGFGVLGGSAMSGVALWAVIGPLVMLAGVALVVRGVRGPGRAGGASGTGTSGPRDAR